MLGLNLGLWMAAMGGGGFNLHLDSAAAGGGDGSKAAPFNSATDLLTAMGTTPNLRIGVKYGSVITQSLVLTANHTGTYIDAYGDEGDGLPEWRCDDVVAAGDWSLAAGRTNVYRADLTVEIDANAAELPGIWEDGQALTFSAVNLSAAEGIPGTFWHGTVTDDTTITVYIHPYGSTNPTSDGKEYRASKRKGLDAYLADDVTIRHQKGRRNYTSYGSITGGRGCLIQHCEQHEGPTHNIFVRSEPSASARTSVVEDNLCRDSYRPDSSPTLYVAFVGTAPASSKATHRRCRAELTYNSSKTIQTVTGATSASPCVLTITAHTFVNGDIITASDFTGPWAALNGQRFVITGAAANTISLQQVDLTTGGAANFSTAALAAYSSNGGKIRLAPYTPGVTGFYSHTGGATNNSEMNYEDCETQYCGLPFSAANCVTLNITSTDPTALLIEQFNQGIKASALTTNVTGVKAENTPAISGAIAAITDATNITMNFDNVDFHMNSTGNFRISHTGCTMTIQDSRLSRLNADFFCNVANATVVLERNDYVPGTRQFNAYNIGASATGLTFISDNNAFNGASVNIIYLGTTHALFADYKAASGQDANSTP